MKSITSSYAFSALIGVFSNNYALARPRSLHRHNLITHLLYQHHGTAYVSRYLASLLDDDLRERFPRGLDRLAVQIRSEVRNGRSDLAEQPRRAQLVGEFLFRHGCRHGVADPV